MSSSRELRERRMRQKKRIKARFNGQRCHHGNKLMFMSRLDAQEHAERVSRRLKEFIVSYKCPHCNRWHVGHEWNDIDAAFGKSG
jgi:hypothetical protein